VFTSLFRKQDNLNKLNKLNINNIKLNYKVIDTKAADNVTKYNYNFLFKNFLNTKNNMTCFFLRKSKFFNKGRYSRNRQIYRTGVYLCFYVNIIVLYLIWFVFYRSSIKFTYLWWVFFALPSSFIFSRALKYNLFFPKEFTHYTRMYFNWLVAVFNAIFFRK